MPFYAHRHFDLQGRSTSEAHTRVGQKEQNGGQATSQPTSQEAESFKIKAFKEVLTVLCQATRV